VPPAKVGPRTCRAGTAADDLDVDVRATSRELRYACSFQASGIGCIRIGSVTSSSVTKSQFIASQVAITGTFLPAMMLSGFLFDVRSMPAAIRTITYILPARYYVALLQTIFLAGDIWSVIVPNAAVLAAMAAGLLLLARVATQKKLA
jgi:ABC-type multidrug transport system permease subunit